MVRLHRSNRLTPMIRCDNDECILSRECWRFLIAPQDADGVDRYEPQTTKEYDELMSMAGLTNEMKNRLAVKCNYFIVLADPEDNPN